MILANQLNNCEIVVRFLGSKLELSPLIFGWAFNSNVDFRAGNIVSIS